MIQRGSDKHSARVDDQLRHEVQPLLDGAPVEGHSRGDLQKEGPGADGEAEIDPYVRPSFDAVPGGPSDDELEARAELAQALRPSIFPATADQLLTLVEEDGTATDRIVETLRKLPPDRSYDNVQEVWATAGGTTEGRHSSGDTDGDGIPDTYDRQ